MQSNLVISLDAMGGDDAPHIVIDGAALAQKKYPQAKFLIFGDEAQVRPLLRKHPELAAASELRHTPDRVTSEEKPSVALRAGRNSSMRLAIDAVGKGEAHCIVSAGNTGALMAMAKFVLKVLPGITRPAIAAVLPTKISGHGTVMLDLGANVECDAQNFLEFSILGEVFSREVLKIKEPRIGILNIGSEAIKGDETVKAAYELISATPNLPGKFIGFVEGDDIGAGTVDVIVTDGFTGNVALKSIEGTARLIASVVKKTFKASPLSLLAAILGLPGLLLSAPALWSLKKRFDPRLYNGASFAGLKGLCIKSHGGTDAIGFCNAISVAADMAISGFNEKVAQELENLGLGQNRAAEEE